VTGDEVQRSIDKLQMSIDEHVTALPAQADAALLGKILLIDCTLLTVLFLAEWLIELRCKALLATAHQPFSEREVVGDNSPLTGVKQETAALLAAQGLTGDVLFVAPVGARTIFGNQIESGEF